MSRKIYSVYVVELSKRVFSENRKFREANPQFNAVLECLYVGMTSKTPEERLKQHLTGALSKKGYKISSDIVQKYGMYLRPSLYSHLNPLTREEALKMEAELANKLKRARYAVWWN
jgi:predicted GIY-YIG superfamily endonuclease